MYDNYLHIILLISFCMFVRDSLTLLCTSVNSSFNFHQKMTTQVMSFCTGFRDSV